MQRSVCQACFLARVALPCTPRESVALNVAMLCMRVCVWCVNCAPLMVGLLALLCACQFVRRRTLSCASLDPFARVVACMADAPFLTTHQTHDLPTRPQARCGGCRHTPGAASFASRKQGRIRVAAHNAVLSAQQSSVCRCRRPPTTPPARQHDAVSKDHGCGPDDGGHTCMR